MASKINAEKDGSKKTGLVNPDRKGDGKLAGMGKTKPAFSKMDSAKNKSMDKMPVKQFMQKRNEDLAKGKAKGTSRRVY